VDKPNQGIITYIHGRATRKLPVSCLKQAKILLSFILFSFTKLENMKAELVLGRGEEVGKGYKNMHILQILCTHVCKWKHDTC
jgi:hypothetical protein